MSWLLPLARTSAIFPRSPAMLEVQRVTRRKLKSLETFPIIWGTNDSFTPFSKKHCISAVLFHSAVLMRLKTDTSVSVGVEKQKGEGHATS